MTGADKRRFPMLFAAAGLFLAPAVRPLETPPPPPIFVTRP